MANMDVETPTLGTLAEQSRDRLRTMRQSPETERERAVRGVIRDSTLGKQSTLAETTGPADQKEALNKRYNGLVRETAVAEKLDETWLQYGLRKAKDTVSAGAEVVKTPFRWAVNAVKNHPYLTVGTATLVGAGLVAYFTGFGSAVLAPIVDWLGKQPGEVRKLFSGGVRNVITPSSSTGAGQQLFQGIEGVM